MTVNFTQNDPLFGQLDLDDVYISNDWLINQFVGGQLFSWGNDSYGQLGDGTVLARSSPVQIGALRTWRDISVGYRHVLLVKNDNTLWAMGINDTGQLGTNNIVYYSSPVQIGALANWKQVSAGQSQSLAIKTDGTLWGWGSNTTGELGNTSSGVTNSPYSSPIQIGSLTNWAYVSAGPGISMAIKTDGTMWSWGSGLYGAIGNNSNNINYSSPIQIGIGTTWKTVSAGGSLASPTGFAIDTTGALWVWGSNQWGQLGNNSIAYVSSPVQLGSLTNWKQVFNSGTSLAVKTDGTLWGWGLNTNGQTGNGNTLYYSSPVQIGSLSNWSKIALSSLSAAAIKSDGTLWAWGQNASGQLGNGNIVNYSSPVQVGSLTNWKRIYGNNNNAGTGNFTALTFTDVG